MKGELVHMTLFDVGAEVDLSRIERLLGRPTQPAPLVSRSQAPQYAPFPLPKEVRFAEPDAPPGTQVEVRLHRVGVVAVRIRIPAEAATLHDWQDLRGKLQIRGQGLRAAAARWYDELQADIRPAVIEPYPGLVEPETYTVFCITDPVADELLGRNREGVAALIAGEVPGSIVPAVVDSALKHTVRYYRDDAVVIGWDNALVVAQPGGYEDVLDVMELANLQLLEFRTYDAYLDDRLDASFAALDRLWAPGGLFRSARAALQDISELRVDFARLTDNLHDTGKLFGEWYVAKLHQNLRDSFHLASWERAVAGKMQTLEDMFQLAEEEANHRRSLWLEVAVVVLFVLDLVLIWELR
ncbi:MAG: hypothetical protein V4510_06410 [bacterium]